MAESDLIWFLCFWGLVVLLCAAERLCPAFEADADRGNRWPVNFGLGIVNGLISSIVPSLNVLLAAWASSRVGLFHLVAVPLWAELALTIVVLSFAQYAFHWCAHRYPPLWRVHEVHHSDEHLDASSALRFHPLELAATIIFVSLFILIFGLSPRIVAFYELAQVIVGLLTHANLNSPVEIERRMRWLFITPVLHRFHHSTEPAENDSNFGNVFSVWDRVFGTLSLKPAELRRPDAFGLNEPGSAQSPDLTSVLLLRRHTEENASRS